ncbi:hypothetical protein B566_EDAN003972 [Ephemera danica]|nr:hypothetical protein B566_EDAN003972 [Ephemera danica]
MAAQPASMTSHPVHVYAGDDALITCVVRGAASSGALPSVIWARMKVGSELEMHREDAPREILTAGLMRVTSDTRVHVIHDAVGEVWVLGIRDVTPGDSGLYVCEVANEKEPLRSFHKLSACCAKEGVIDLCIDVCRGQYTPSTDSIKTHFSCDAYTEQLLPSTPRHVKVDAISEHTLLVSWNFPAQNAHTVSQYEIEVRLVTSLDLPEPKVLDFMVDDSAFTSTEVFSSSSTVSSVTTTAPPTQPPFKLQLKVPGTYNSSLVSSLKPFTMYEVSVTATNSHGNSLPSPAIRTLTLVPGQSKRSDSSEDAVSGATPPPIPDVRACCESHGNMDRKCIEYVGIYSSCLLQSYGLLPSAPGDILVSNIHSDFAIIHWSPPKTLASTVRSYNVHYRELDGGEDDVPFRTSIDAQTPFILSQLMADSTYELYVQAVNEHGVGEPSQRIVFRTPALDLEEELEQVRTF